MNKMDILKSGIGLIVSVGVGTIAGNAIKTTTPNDMTRVTKFCVGAASLALTGLLGDKAAKYTEDQIDTVVENIKNLTTVNDEQEENLEMEA